MQDKNEKLNTFENFLLNNAGTLLQNESLDNAIQNKMAEYRQYGVDLTSYDAKEEVFAEAVGRLFEDEGAIQHLYKADRNLFQRVYDWIVHTISKIGKDADTKLLMDAQRKFVLAMQESSGVLRENADNSPMASYVGTDANGIRHYKSDLIGYSEDDRKWFFNTYFQDHFNGAEVELDGVDGEIKVKANRKSINKNLYSGNAAEKTKFPFDLVDILKNAKLNDIEKEPSFFDPNIEPKNDAHRNTKYWHHYKSIVNLDGTDYEITFSVAEKVNGSFKFYYAGMQKASILTGSLNDRHRRILASKDSIDENQFKVNPILENNSSDVFSMVDSLDIDGNSTPLHLRNDDELYSLGDGTPPPMNFEYDIDNPSRQQKVRSVFETASESERVAPEIRENILKNIEDKAPSVMYDVISNKETIDKAKHILETQGAEQTEAAIEHKIATNQNLTLDDLAIAIGMVEHYSKIGDLEKSERMI